MHVRKGAPISPPESKGSITSSWLATPQRGAWKQCAGQARRLRQPHSVRKQQVHRPQRERPCIKDLMQPAISLRNHRQTLGRNPVGAETRSEATARCALMPPKGGCGALKAATASKVVTNAVPEAAPNVVAEYPARQPWESYCHAMHYRERMHRQRLELLACALTDRSSAQNRDCLHSKRDGYRTTSPRQRDIFPIAPDLNNRPAFAAIGR